MSNSGNVCLVSLLDMRLFPAVAVLLSSIECDREIMASRMLVLEIALLNVHHSKKERITVAFSTF